MTSTRLRTVPPAQDEALDKTPELPLSQDACLERGWPCYDRCPDHEFRLPRQSDIRGLLHCHTRYDGGAHGLDRIVDTALELGLEYLGITDRLQSAWCPDGLTPAAFARQREEIEAVRESGCGLELLHGVEVEMGPDGEAPPELDAILDQVDFVAATLLDGNGADRRATTRRALHAVMNPVVSILGHPVGDYLTAGGDLPLDLDAVLVAAAEAGVAVELDANPRHDDLSWHHCEEAQERGIVFVLASDAHRAARLIDYRHGAELSRRAGICCHQILNTRPVDEVRAFFRRGKRG